ncbi:SusC/RagA family TonB-linked outer membrane protein [Sinomicrobium oceani]|uniref:SusC/RagA family TonB-linked outer membrane protein n=1 Tax=Sinomicrobium oceani TaxID=1150368 RepID=UPI00227D3A9C|nr:TonB-dependent receptor [Sinomicrobium oceani]
MKTIYPSGLFLSRRRNPVDFGIRARTLFMVLCLCCSLSSFAQRAITGTVTDQSGAPLPGVSITEKGTTTGAVSDFDGNFTLYVGGQSPVLIFSYMGFETQEITVGNRSSLQVQMQEDVTSLSEVIVIGYGTQEKKDVTSAVASIKSEEFLVGKIQDASELVKGKVAGLVITKSSGSPDASSNIMLRGVTTLTGNVNPLILIDGVPGDINTVAPENIESIDVLKDASAAAIYGTRGANGVIFITTRSGTRERPATVNYVGYTSISDFYKKADFMNVSDIRAGKTSYNDRGAETDWLDAVTRTGFMHNHSLNIDGGTKTTAYSGNVSYRYEDGTIKKSNNDQIRVQLNLSQYFLDNMLKVNINVLKDYRTLTPNNAESEGLNNIYRQAVIRNPTAPVYTQDGDWDEELDRYQYYNPVAILDELVGEDEREKTNMIGNITFKPVDNWETNLMLSNNLYNKKYATYTTSRYYTSKVTGFAGSAYIFHEDRKQKTLELTSNYKFNLDKHRFSVLGGYSYIYERYSNFSVSNSDFPTDAYKYNNITAGDLLKEGRAGMNSFKEDNTLIGFFGRVSYGFDNKYNILASIRREGSSKFGDNHKWGLFPAVSAGWTISNEGFMESLKWVDNLKLRAGYGVTGQRPLNNYSSLTTFQFNNSGTGNYYNKEGEWIPSIRVAQNPNPDLKWEKTAEINVGVDFTLFEGRLSGALDVYNKKTTDLIYQYNVPVPPNLANTTLANVGSISNKGVEIMINAIPVKNDDFQWNTTLTLSHNRSKLLSMSNDLYKTEDYRDEAFAGDPISVPTHRVEVGRAIGDFWGMKSVGVTEDGIWLIEDPQTGEALTYSTSLNNNSYRQYLGNGFPKVYLGLNNTFRYKNFDLNMQMSGQFGFKILNEQRMYYENNSIQYNRLRSAADPVYGIAPLSPSQAQAFVSYYLEKGDFLKFDNVTLGYNVNVGKLEKYLSALRVYCSAQNFLTITGYKGMDPELANRNFYAAGNDFRDKYPTIRSLTLGLNVTFK